MTDEKRRRITATIVANIHCVGYVDLSDIVGLGLFRILKGFSEDFISNFILIAIWKIEEAKGNENE